ncbi:MAG TPA: Type 1 glutamine amidotransferase-like domain-containing protein [Ignavibacteria bacterium]
MSKLFLSGGGHANKTKKLDRLFEAHVPRAKRVLYIPIAMPPRIYTFGQCFDWINVVFPRLQIDMWTSLSDRKWEELFRYGAIYIGGGNTYSLLDNIRFHKFDRMLARYYKDGGIIYGGSAGAIIFGRDIQTAGFGSDADRNYVGLEEFEGLNLVNGYSIQCHYSTYDDKEIVRYAKKHKINVIALPDDTGLVVEGKKMKVIGESNAVLFTKSTKVVYIPGSVV